MRSTVKVRQPKELGRAAQVALDELMATHNGKIQFPLFMDIHPAEQFEHVAWMHGNKHATAGGKQASNRQQ